MISYVLKNAEQSNLFSKIHVSTESNKIIEVIKNLGFIPEFLRPLELADDKTPIMPVLQWIVKEFLERQEEFDEIWLLYACNPFLNYKTLIDAANYFSSQDSDNPLLAVLEYPVPAQWALTFSKTNILKPLSPGKNLIRSQDLLKTYYDAGSFSIFPTKRLLSKEKINKNDDFIGFKLPKFSSVDIDDDEDWKFAERLYFLKNNILQN